eukprot:c6626_g1_i1.p1 GENE.c6626_g1_i1~~c6626_g1_i1.p1  ORF type:complete len:292 (-),score=64.67 c6626_g1_i1:280-1155(-)
MDLFRIRFPEPPTLEWTFMVQYSHEADSSFMTYFTFYVLSTVCLALAALVGLKQSSADGSRSDTRIISVTATFGFFVSIVIYTFSMGWLHEYYPRWDNTEPRAFVHLWNLACIALVFAASFIFFVAETQRRSKGFGAQDETSGTVQTVLYVLVLAITLAVVIFSAAEADVSKCSDKQLIAYIYISCMMLYLLVISGMDLYSNSALPCLSSRHYVTAVGMFALGLFLQLAMGGVCGGPAAAETKGCPMPDSFNHNALFNLFVLIGVMVLALGMLRMVDEDAPDDDVVVAKAV